MGKEEFKYEGKFIQVSEEVIDEKVFERVYIHDSMVIFPITNEGKILFIKEYRPHEKPNERWKPVTGFYESGDLTENVNRELQEEIGKIASKVELYFKVKPSGTINSTTYFAIARDLTDSKLPNPDGEETILDVHALSLDEMVERTVNGEFAKGIAAYAIMRMHYEVGKGILLL